MVKIYKISKVEKPRNCDGCKKLIEKGSSCIYHNASWRGMMYKAYYHNERCMKDEQQSR